MERTSEKSPMKRTGCSSSAARTLSFIHKRCAGHRISRGISQGRSRAAKAPCSIPLWPSGIESLSIQKSQRRSICCPASARPATHAWALLRSTRIGVSRIACSTWRGPITRWSCARSMPQRPTRNSMDALPVLSSTPIPRCVPTRASSAGTAADNPVYGGTPFPATSRSCCCGSETRPISAWCTSSSRPMRTGV